MARDWAVEDAGSSPSDEEIHPMSCLLSARVDAGGYQSAWGKPGAVILETEILRKLNLGAWEAGRI